MRKVILAILGTVLLLTACTSGSARPEEGITYVASGADGFELVQGSTAAIEFARGQVVLRTGCNSATGDATWSGSTLKVEEYAITEMGCEEDLMKQEAILVELLTSEPTITRSGDTLTLSGSLGDGSSAEVTFAVREQLALENTHWQLTGLGTDDGQTLTALPDGVSSTLAFTDSEVLIEYGCNSGGGQVSIDAQTLTFGELNSTMMMCPPEAMEVEQHVTDVLQGEANYTATGPSLTIAKGSLTLQYEPAG